MKGTSKVRLEDRRLMYCISEMSQHEDDRCPLIGSHMSSNDFVSFWTLAPLSSLSQEAKLLANGSVLFLLTSVEYHGSSTENTRCWIQKARCC